MSLTRPLLRSAAALALLSFFAHAQVQVVEPTYKKWLECDIDWLISGPSVVGPEFSVKLSFQEKPVADIRLALARGGVFESAPVDGGIVATADTDSEGTARFFAILPGRYTAIAEDGLLFPSDVEIQVRARKAFGQEVAVVWPERSISVRALRGKLVTSEQLSDVPKPLQNSALELLDLRSSQLVEAGQTNPDGTYEFATTAPGLYVLRVTPPASEGKNESESHDVAIQLDPGAKKGAIPTMKVLQSDCAGVQLFRKVGKDWQEQ